MDRRILFHGPTEQKRQKLVHTMPPYKSYLSQNLSAACYRTKGAARPTQPPPKSKPPVIQALVIIVCVFVRVYWNREVATPILSTTKRAFYTRYIAHSEAHATGLTAFQTNRKGYESFGGLWKHGEMLGLCVLLMPARGLKKCRA